MRTLERPGVRLLLTTREDGDVRTGAPGALDRRRRLGAGEWTTVRQVHGSRLIAIDQPGGALGQAADALFTTAADVPLAMLGADCALVVLVGARAGLAVAHAGWKGLLDGVLEVAAEALEAEGAGPIDAYVSPMIYPECYAFSSGDLDVLAERLGEHVRAETADGAPALDLPASVDAALAAVGVRSVEHLGRCTACEGPWYSWRARREEERHALVAWRPPT